jgi:hypothetical protein
VFRKVQRNTTDELLEQTVRRDLDFLFAQHDATVTANTIEAFGISALRLSAGNVEFQFTNNSRDADDRILVGPRNANGIWELLHVALVAATGEDARSLIVQVQYDDQPSQFANVGLTRVAEILKPRFMQLDLAFRPENYSATHSRMVQIERQVHPR